MPADFQILHSRIRHHFTDSGSAVVLRGTELVELRLHTQQEVKEAFTEDRTGSVSYTHLTLPTNREV